MLGLLNTVLSKGNTLLTYVKDGLVMANRFLTPPKLTHPAQGSAEFNGTSDYIQLNESFSHTNHTIAAWVYISEQADTRLIFDNRDADNDGFRFLLTGTENFFYSVNTSDLIDNGQPKDEWIYFVGTYNGVSGLQSLYKNGSVLAQAVTSQTISTTTNARIGRTSYDPAIYFKGNLANVAIWNRALSSDEINSVMWKSYEALSGTESNGLQAWYALDDITSPAASLANMQQLATDKNATIENTAAITAAINSLS